MIVVRGSAFVVRIVNSILGIEERNRLSGF